MFRLSMNNAIARFENVLQDDLLHMVVAVCADVATNIVGKGWRSRLTDVAEQAFLHLLFGVLVTAVWYGSHSLSNCSTLINVVSLIDRDFAMLHGLPDRVDAFPILMARAAHVVAEAVAVMKWRINEINFILFA